MRAVEFLSELRRNPDQNPRLTGTQAIQQRLENMSDEELDRVGMSMTEQPKLGINPQSVYNTPLGVYFYPARFWLEQRQQNKKLPFMDRAPHIQLFSFSGNVLDLARMEDTELERGTQVLRQVAAQANIDPDKEWQYENYDANNKSPAGLLWYRMMRLSIAMQEITKRNSAVAWNSLIRRLGYTTVIDWGLGIVHPSEPTQGFVVDPRSIRHIGSFENEHRFVNRRTDSQIGKAIASARNPDFIQTAVHALGKVAFSINDKTRKSALALCKKVMSHLRANPIDYQLLTYDSTYAISRVLGNDDLVAEMWAGYATAKWPKINHDIGRLILKKSQMVNGVAAYQSLNMSDFSEIGDTLPYWNGILQRATKTPEVLSAIEDLHALSDADSELTQKYFKDRANPEDQAYYRSLQKDFVKKPSQTELPNI